MGRRSAAGFFELQQGRDAKAVLTASTPPCYSLKVVATYHGDHAYCFDVTGAGSPASSAATSQQAGGQPFNLFAQPAASAALAAGTLRHGLTTSGRLRNGSSPVSGAGSSANGYSGSSSSGSGGGMGDLPGMLPAAAERAKADGNLALFSKQLYEAVQHYSAAIRLAPWAPSLYTNRALALLQVRGAAWLKA